jgi:hypothetical protein
MISLESSSHAPSRSTAAAIEVRGRLESRKASNWRRVGLKQRECLKCLLKAMHSTVESPSDMFVRRGESEKAKCSDKSRPAGT